MTDQFVDGRFAGKTAIVTGAGSGIGRATAVRLVHEGARVIATDVMEERLQELHGAVDSSQLVTVSGDVAAPGTVDALVAAADGRIDALANVAGIMDGFLPVAEMEDALWERVFDVNVTAVMRLTRAVLPFMLAAGAGSIVNVSSEAGLRGSAAGTAYTTSKHAVNGLTKSTAFFYGPQGIRCNAVAPGGVATNIDASMKSEFAGQRLRSFMETNVPSVATPEELAAAITWLLSDDAANVSGVILASDGGWAAI
ncbi:SDR family NAD(P)-dependent oxidoreductase [Arthrobacter wenxiniae]|uniref:SDR family NAD(P)-dependent oxidoreductase n=1 Tax=Arthrobacter wenxiniae TaxID=2713570 RepID=A0A7Y7IEY1_9MICC|nr:SDR family NAD(P)-dependent oxidoreductase [Arthrobacter wenxiniae]NVM94251.1 SDR family NAD(P)-dependent oxidoreductase [Arthrobacter wenxiniae]